MLLPVVAATYITAAINCQSCPVYPRNQPGRKPRLLCSQLLRRERPENSLTWFRERMRKPGSSVGNPGINNPAIKRGRRRIARHAEPSEVFREFRQSRRWT
jgi:hypothetical protein